jgi:uncharacterized phage protein gp47/JayE
MASTPAINYSSRDYNTILASLQARIKARFPNDWKDFYASSVGVALLESVAFAFDSLSFAVDYTANEIFPDTSRDRVSSIKQGKLMGYQLRTPTSASVVCVASLSVVQGIDVIIPAGVTVQNKDGIEFYTVEDQRIPAGELTAEITFVQGVVHSQSYVSDGSAFQKVVLTTSPVVQDTLVVTVNGEEWSQEVSLVYGDSDSLSYSVEFDVNNKATVCFGDDDSGKVPPTGATVEILYRVGGGVAGNIDASTIVQSAVTSTGGLSVGITNEEPGSGGEDAETTTHAKLWMPRWVRANSRAVTEQDYDTLANTFSDPVYGAPAFAKARLKQNIPELNTVVIACFGRDGEGNIVVPYGGKAALSAYFNNDGPGSVKMICTRTEVEDGVIVYVDAAVDIKVSSEYVASSVLANVDTALRALFSADTNTPGASVRISTVYNAVHDVAGVEYCIIRKLTASEKSTVLAGVGNASDKTFVSTVMLEPGVFICAYSVQVFYGSTTESLVDNGQGELVNTGGVVVGTVDYVTGEVSATFANAPDTGVNVYCLYRSVLEYDRSSNQEVTCDGVARRFRGNIKYSPVNPYDAGSGTKGISFTDGVQLVHDDGDGNLVGDVDAGGTNVFDYDTGTYDFTFASAPETDAIIYSSYTQLLSVDSKDVPIDKNQIAVVGTITKNVL